jgi:hypothetical protein
MKYRRNSPAREKTALVASWQYSVRLSVGGNSVTQSLVVARDPRLPSTVTDAHLVRQHELSREVQPSASASPWA